MLRTLAVAGYRTLRELVLQLGQLTVITGPNGSGKSNLYRAMRLLSETALGGSVASLAAEGGLSSVLWAGPETFARSVRRGEHRVEGGPRSEPARVRLGFAGDDFGYAVDFGMPVPIKDSDALARSRACTSVVLHKELGETLIPGQSLLDRASWVWPPK